MSFYHRSTSFVSSIFHTKWWDWTSDNHMRVQVEGHVESRHWWIVLQWSLQLRVWCKTIQVMSIMATSVKVAGPQLLICDMSVKEPRSNLRSLSVGYKIVPTSSTSLQFNYATVNKCIFVHWGIFGSTASLMKIYFLFWCFRVAQDNTWQRTCLSIVYLSISLEYIWRPEHESHENLDLPQNCYGLHLWPLGSYNVVKYGINKLHFTKTVSSKYFAISNSSSHCTC